MSQDSISPAFSLLAAELDQPVPADAVILADRIREIHGTAVAGIVFYGSCLRDGVTAGRMLDFYVLTESYRAFHRRAAWAWLNRLLPPNVYRIALQREGRGLQAKYAVVSLDDLERWTAGHALQPYLWGRFSQPCALVYARDTMVRSHVLAALRHSVERMVAATLPLLQSPFDAAGLWTRGFQESYRTELRAERANRAATIYANAPERYDRLLADIAQSGRSTLVGHEGQARYSTAGGQPARLRAWLTWRARRIIGRTFHILRLVKAAFTFAGGLDYLLWKIEQHSGTRLEPTTWQRRHPILAAPFLAWQLFRRGAVR